jgi:dTDP-4-dehydrorhamnose reductase
MRIAVVGARGQLGAAIVHELSSRHEVASFDHASLDITDPARVADEMSRARPDAIINCAGYNFVDAAEDHPLEALRTNAIAVRTLARAAAAGRAILVHFSSDFVFDGSATAPYSEEDRPNPRSVYAASKLVGEWFAIDAPRSYVVRVESLFGGSPGAGPAKGSVATILNALRAGAPARVFEDRTVSPTYVVDAVRATRAMVERQPPGGIYHCVNSGRCTWLDFAREAARQMGVEPKLEPIRLADVALRAHRPLFCAMSNAKLASIGIPMPEWQDALARHLQERR